jgi:hypothetical protein
MTARGNEPRTTGPLRPAKWRPGPLTPGTVHLRADASACVTPVVATLDVAAVEPVRAVIGLVETHGSQGHPHVNPDVWYTELPVGPSGYVVWNAQPAAGSGYGYSCGAPG